MSKEKNKSNSKTTTKNEKTSTKKQVEEKVTNSKITKDTKKEKQDKELKKKVEEIDEKINEDESLEDEFEDEDLEIVDEDLDNEEDNEEEFDEDLEEENEPEEKEEVVKIKEVKKPKETKTKAKPEIKKEKIEKIEKIAKEKKKKVKTSNAKTSTIITNFEKYHTEIYCFIAGVLITTLIAFIIWPDRIAALKNGTEPVVKVNKKTYTADELYENMKDYYSVSLLLDDIDNDILTKLYPEDDTMTEKVKSNAEYYLNMYKQYYNYTEEQFLQKNGFSSYNAFLDYLRLDYRRNKYLDDYVEKNLTDDEIDKYYNDNVFGDINTQHVLVEVKSDSDSEDSKKLSDEDAKKLAEEIISKLNDGTSWETIQKDYKDKITFEDLGYQTWDASLEESFMTALKGMEDNSYSNEPVKTSYGYHVIYRIDQKKKPSLKKTKDKIIENLVSAKKEKDSNLLYKSLIKLREEKKIDFSDTVMKSKYDEYCKQYK